MFAALATLAMCALMSPLWVRHVAHAWRERHRIPEERARSL